MGSSVRLVALFAPFAIAAMACAADDDSGTDTGPGTDPTVGPATTGTTGDTSSGSDPSTATSVGTSTGTTAGATTGPPPDPYGDCKLATECPVFGVCGESLVPSARGCRPDCAPDCPAAQGGSSRPTCLDQAPTPFCYLPCNTPGEQGPCPDGMICATNTVFSVDMCGWPVG